MLGLDLTKRLRPFLGGRLALLVGLAWGWLGNRVHARRSPRVMAFEDTIAMFFQCAVASAGVATLCIDADGAEGYARFIQPFTALGPNHVGSLMHEFAMLLSQQVRDRPGSAYAGWQRLLAILEDPAIAKQVPARALQLYRGGALYACGVMECFRDGSAALEYAERLERMQLRIYDMSADQVRMMYYANQGDLDRYEQFRQRVEMHAIQRGTAWQVEVWSPSALIGVYSRTHDTVGIKHCADQLKRLSREIPSLAIFEYRARGSYLSLQGRHGEAVAELERELEAPPLRVIGWTRTLGALARSYNAMGAHRRAKELCERVLSLLTEDDLQFVALCLSPQVELAMAESGLGDNTAAAARLDTLLARHEPRNGPLTLAALHEARARVASAVGDDGLYELHLGFMETWCRRTKMPSMVERYERFAKEHRRSSSTQPHVGRRSARPPRVATVIHRLKHGGEDSDQGRAHWALAQLADYASAEDGYLYLVDSDGKPECVSHLGKRPTRALTAWVAERLEDAFEYSTQVARGPRAVPSNEHEIDGTIYRLALLVKHTGSSETLVGAAVLCGPSTLTLGRDLLETVAARLTTERRHGH